MWTVFVTGVLCNFVCGVEESSACGLYPPLYVHVCHFQCGGGSMITIWCVIPQLSYVRYMLIYIQCMAS